MSVASQPIHSSSQVLHKKRMQSTNKRNSAKALGAVRLKDLGGDGLPAVADEKIAVSNTVNGTSPEKVESATCEQLLSPTSRFESELARDQTTDKWFDEQLRRANDENNSCASSGTSKKQPASRTGETAREKLTRQLRSIQETFKQHLNSSVLGFEDPASGEALEGTAFHVGQSAAAESQGPSIFDLGLDAIHRMGQTCADIATRVDTTIEQWLERFQSVEELHRFLDTGGRDARPQTEPSARRGGLAARPKTPAEEATGPLATDSPRPPRNNRRSGAAGGGPATPCARAQEGPLTRLQEEMARKEAEFLRVQEECKRLQAELTYAANKCSALTEENSLLRSSGEPAPFEGAEPDPITEFMAMQLEALLSEKSKLAQENARLARENVTLQDMLTFSLECEDPCEGASESEDHDKDA
uniref:Uncharacterized protein n=2 Tax=Tetraselmis sp. GSL018 TaxID=582737 RepID=A0A061QX19_9CHLO|mmetsp:Transcript_42465/g.100778  ORF Transcript_42465/g.100778 Transcript_42465/m.100778 type:complete len:416 (-) Transcript_42465:180-1427(-)